MNNFKIDFKSIEPVARVLADMNSGAEISLLLKKAGFNDYNSNEYDYSETKWKRLNNHFVYSIDAKNNYCLILKYIELNFDPRRNLKKEDSFYDNIREINNIISFDGFKISETGKIINSYKSTTIREAKINSSILYEKLEHLKVHPKVLMFCKPDIVHEDYTSIIFESCKCLYDHIRLLTGLDEDGSKLIYEVFNEQKPLIVFNSLQTPNEKNEHKGFKHLLLFIGFMFRNPRAHSPKIFSIDSEADCIYALQTISFALYKLNECHSIKI